MVQSQISQPPATSDCPGPPSSTSNRDIQDRAERTFFQSSYAGLRHVQCEFLEGVLTLKGRVGSFYLKQIAQAVARQVVGVDAVDNRLAVNERKQLEGPRFAG